MQGLRESTIITLSGAMRGFLASLASSTSARAQIGDGAPERSGLVLPCLGISTCCTSINFEVSEVASMQEPGGVTRLGDFITNSSVGSAGLGYLQALTSLSTLGIT